METIMTGATDFVEKFILLPLIEMLIGIVNTYVISSGPLNSTVTGRVGATDLVHYFQGLAIAILMAKTLINGWRTYQLNLTGDNDVSRTQYIINTAIAVFLVGVIPSMMDLARRWGNMFVRDLIAYANDANATQYHQGQDILTMKQLTDFGKIYVSTGVGTTLGILPILLSLALLVPVMIVTWQLLKRTIELLILYVTSPMFALTYQTPDHSLFNAFVRQVIGIIGAQGLQILLLIWGIGVALQKPPVGVAILSFAVALPRLLQNTLAQSAGGGGTTRNIVNMVGMAATRMI